MADAPAPMVDFVGCPLSCGAAGNCGSADGAARCFFVRGAAMAPDAHDPPDAIGA